MDPKRALVREPGKAFTRCLSCHPLRHTVNLEKAREQHGLYCGALRDLGLEVIKLSTDDLNPDACFVEDNAVVHGNRALVCRMGAPSRRGEISSVEQALRGLGLGTKRAVEPATVEGGDVVHLEDRLLSGLSKRTNEEGIRQMSEWLGVRVDSIEDPSMMHLKSHVTYLGKGLVIASPRYAKHGALSGLRVLIAPAGEEYAADTLAVGDSVIIPTGMHRTAALLSDAGFNALPVDVSEFEKCDGAVTCLSVLI